jgi:hypothetical protein
MNIQRRKIKSFGRFSSYILTDNQGFEHEVQIQHCKDPDLYVNPGYYLMLCNEKYYEDLFKKPFRTAKSAAVAYFKLFFNFNHDYKFLENGEMFNN